jgi:predicted nucleic acid-binding protein
VADRIALDSGAVIKLSNGDPLPRAVLRKWIDEGWEMIVPSPVLAEALGVDRRTQACFAFSIAVLRRLQSSTFLSWVARDAGKRLGDTGMAPRNTVDALIVATAVAEHAEHILTVDARDITPLASADLKVISL